MKKSSAAIACAFGLVLLGSAQLRAQGTPPPDPAARPADPAARPADPAARPADPAPAATGTPPAAGASKEQESYAIKLRQLAEKISTLKELVSQTKIRLSLLKESVLGKITAGSELIIIQDNRMTSSYRLMSYRYLLDGKQIDSAMDLTGKASEKGVKTIYNGPAPEGSHVVTVEYIFRGHGFGVFSYLDKYKYTVQSSFRFKVTPGVGTQIKVVAVDLGGLRQRKDRIAVRYDKTDATLTVKGVKAAPAPGASRP